MMMIRSCRDCANFEDRRDIDGTALCAKNMGPHVCCEEFEPTHESINANRLYNRFCVECANFEDVNGVSLCSRNHVPIISCDEFKSRFEKLNIIQLNNRIKTTLVAYTATYHNPKPIPSYVIEVGRKIKW